MLTLYITTIAHSITQLLLCFQNVQQVTTNIEMPEPELLGYKPTATEGKSYNISWSTSVGTMKLEVLGE